MPAGLCVELRVRTDAPLDAPMQKSCPLILLACALAISVAIAGADNKSRTPTSKRSATSAAGRPTTALSPTSTTGVGVKPLIITLADKDKPLTATVGQMVEVRLDGLRVRTGWETGKVHGPLESAGDSLRQRRPLEL